MAQAKLLSMTVGLTLLIWVSADQLLQESQELAIRIKLVPAGTSSMSVAPVTVRSEPFRIKVVGRKTLVDRYASGEAINVTLPVSERPTGVHRLELQEELRAVPKFHGLTIEEVQPPQLEILVDHEITVPLPVRVDPGRLAFVSPPAVNPSQVAVTISEATLLGLDGQRPGIPPDARYVTVYAERILADFPEGELFSQEVPLDPRVAGVEVRVEPGKVRLEAKLQKRWRQVTIPAVPIRFEASPAIFNRYFIDRRDNLTLLTQSITVRGPAEVIAQIESGAIRIHGVISLTWPDADSVGSFRHVTPTLQLPPGVECVEGPASVEFRLLPHQPGAAEGSDRTPF
jgi:hypothetical protein